MSTLTRYTCRWTAIYIVLVALPLIAILIGGRSGERSFGIEAGVMLGVLALSIMAVQAAFSGRHARIAPALGVDNILQFHRQVGIGALLLVLAHPLWLIAHDPAYLDYLDPRDETLRAVTLIALLCAIVALVCGSLWRKQIGLSYEYWRLMHGGLTAFLIAGGLGHALMVSHHTGHPIVAGALVLLVAGGLWLVLESRVLRPARLRSRPWTVSEVEHEQGDATTLTLEPCGAHRLRFTPGQFAWITLGDTPFSLQQHPFSIASSAERPERIRMTIKRLGDFTRSVQHLEPGTRAYLEGPYGAFAPDENNPAGAVLIAGGIGITPMMSILRSFRDRGVTVPLWLIYANEKQSEIACRADIKELAQTLRLEVTHVLSDPDGDWEGETGYVDDALISRVLPADDGARDYFICGPEPMMDAAEKALLAHGADTTRIFSDRFDLV